VLSGGLTPVLERDLDRLGEGQLAKPAEALLDFSNAADLERWLASAAREESGANTRR